MNTLKICSACGFKFQSNEWTCPSCNAIPLVIDGHFAFAPELAAAGVDFKSSYFEELYKLEERNFWFRSRNRLILWAIKTYFPGIKRLLEIGCGTGFVLSGIEKAFPMIELYGSEVFSAGLGFAAKRVEKARLFQMDARNIPFENEFDAVCAFDVLEHIKEDDLVLSQIMKSLRQGGGVVLTVPQHPFLWSQNDEYACHVRRYTASELKSKVADAGFKVVKMTSFVTIIFPLMMASRFKKHEIDKEYNPLAELQLGTITNAVLEKLLDLERIPISIGIDLPFGGSLLIIAKKI